MAVANEDQTGKNFKEAEIIRSRDALPLAQQAKAGCRWIRGRGQLKELEQENTKLKWLGGELGSLDNLVFERHRPETLSLNTALWR